MSAHDHNPQAAAASAELFDELDPHGFDKGHKHGHGHVIVGPFTLRSILALLLFFTVLTVFLAQAEVWAQGYFHIELPWWVNVVGAMSIAVVKALLVMGFFMQLKYDNPINTVLMCFTFAALSIFLGFTGMDLFNRAAVDPIRNTSPILGGDFVGGKPLTVAAADKMVEFLAVTQTLNNDAGDPAFGDLSAGLKGLSSEIRLRHRDEPLKFATEFIQEAAKHARDSGDKPKADEWTKVAGTLKAETPQAKLAFEDIQEIIHKAHGHVEEAAPAMSTASQSRPKTGLTNALSLTEPAKGEGAEPAKGEGAEPQKSEEKHAAR